MILSKAKATLAFLAFFVDLRWPSGTVPVFATQVDGNLWSSVAKGQARAGD